MIIDFTISNFRSIKEAQTLSFEATDDTHLEDYFVVKKGKYRLLKLASILGANASGKSNVIRAFSIFPNLVLHPCENKNDKISFDNFALDENTRFQDSEMMVNFLCGEAKYHYEVCFNNNRVCHELLTCLPFDKSREHKVFERDTDKESLVSSITIGLNYPGVSSEIRKLTTNLLHNRTVFGAFQKSNVNIPWMKTIVDWISNYCMPIVKTSEQGLSEFTTRNISQNYISKNQVASLLQKADVGIYDFAIKKVENPIPADVVDMIQNDPNTPNELKERIKIHPTSEDTKVMMMHQGAQGGVFFDFNEESRGTQRYYELSGVLLRLINESHIVAIDELEFSMHPDLYEHFLVTFLTNAKESQLMFTTHMREFLADRDLFRDDSVWFTQKNEMGATELYSLADFGTEVLRKANSRYNAYRSGRLGAVPQLGDTFVEQSSHNGDE